MKEASPALIAFLNSANEIHKCDLYEITLQGGTVLRYADYDADITLPDGRLFTSTGPIFTRGRTKLTSKIEVDSMSVTVCADASDVVGSATWMTAAQYGAFDEANLTLYKCFMSSPRVVVDALEWFGGYVDVEGGGGLEMSWKVKSLMQKLNVDYPTRKFYPTCPYSLYDANCGVDINDYMMNGTVTQVISKQEIYTNLTFGNGYYDLGGVEFISSNLMGAQMSVKQSYSANGRIVFIVALDGLPSVGDTFHIYPGCAKTPAVCSTKFGNQARNRSTPYIPLKETVV
jgi:uncharacterized phage protein (TIGR02218 family)